LFVCSGVSSILVCLTNFFPRYLVWDAIIRHLQRRLNTSLADRQSSQTLSQPALVLRTANQDNASERSTLCNLTSSSTSHGICLSIFATHLYWLIFLCQRLNGSGCQPNGRIMHHSDWAWTRSCQSLNESTAACNSPQLSISTSWW
jgi:hypothetical protein